MYNIHYLNKISPKGTELWTEDYTQVDNMADAQTSIQQWTWNTAILSRHDKPVSVRVEEAAPIARNAAMAIEVSTEPRADFEASRARYVWNLDIPARGQADIVYSVRAAAPQSKD